MPTKKKRLDTTEAAELIGVAPGTLENWRYTNRVRIPYLKIGGAVRYDEADLIAFLESRKVNAAEGNA